MDWRERECHALEMVNETDNNPILKAMCLTHTFLMAVNTQLSVVMYETSVRNRQKRKFRDNNRAGSCQRDEE